MHFTLPTAGGASRPLPRVAPTINRDEDLNEQERLTTSMMAQWFQRYKGKPGGWFSEDTGRVAAVFNFVFGAALIIFWMCWPKMFDFEGADWFFWVCFIVHAVVMLLVFLSRLFGRSDHIDTQDLSTKARQDFSADSVFQRIFNRVPFATTWQLVIVALANFIQCAVTLLALFVTMQACLAEGSYLHELKVVWTLAYVAMSLGVWFQMLSNTFLLDGIAGRDYPTPVCLSSFAFLFGCFCIPVFTVGYALYCAACCSGLWNGI